MVVKLSTTASAQITNHNVNTYVECKLYDANDTYVTDLDVMNSSWNQSKDFGVGTLNLTINNSGGVYNVGETNEIKTDYIVVLIEGFDTSGTNDRFPKFKGYVKNIDFTVSDNQSVVNVTAYDQLILTQRSDLDQIFTASAVQVVGEPLTPFIEQPIADVLETPTDNKVRIKYNAFNTQLNDLVSSRELYISSGFFFISGVALKADGSTVIKTDGTTGALFTSGTVNTLTAGSQITNGAGFRATLASPASGTYGTGSEPVVYIDTTTVQGEFSHGDYMYQIDDPTIRFQVKCFIELNCVKYFDTTVTPASFGIIENDEIFNGLVSVYYIANSNLAEFKEHNFNLSQIGVIGEGDIYDGYEINYKAGLVRFNQPLYIDQNIISASYWYVPTGLYMEDIIEEVITTADRLSVNLLDNGTFIQGIGNPGTNVGNWTTFVSGSTPLTTYALDTNTGLNIKATNDFTANEYVGVSSTTLSLLSGHQYTITANINVSRVGNYATNGSGTIYMVLGSGGAYNSTAANFTDITQISWTYTPTVTSATVFRIYVSGLNIGDIWNINDVQVTYNPAKTNALTTANLYTTVAIEDGSGAVYSLASNVTTGITPLYTHVTLGIIDSTSTIKVRSTTGYEASGTVKIDNEYIHYINKTSATFTGITRETDSSDKANHVIGTKVWQVLSAGRIWTMKYNNIIPKTLESTASTYDAVNGVNVGSAGSFSITGANFSKLYYREGLVITDTVATLVQLIGGSNTNYYFSQLQSTGIETNYMLIDYRQIKTRYDALNEIRTLIAPNYIINAVCRRNGSDYTSFIKGRYLTQLATNRQDYNLDFIGGVTYQKDINNYNRVKMFGKLANPSNLIYEPTTKLYPLNDLGSEYLEGVRYNYINEVNGEAIYTTNDTTQIATDAVTVLDNTPAWIPRWTAWIGETEGYGRNVAEFLNGDTNIFTSDTMIIKTSEWNNVESNYLIGTTRFFHPARFRPGDSTMLNLYNVYYIKYNTGTLSVGDVVNVSGVIKYVQPIPSNAVDDAVIFVEHNLDVPIFNGGDTITTTNGVSGVIALPIIEGTTNQINYNSVHVPVPGSLWGRMTVGRTYQPMISDIRHGTIARGSQIGGTDTKLYLNGLLMTNNATYTQKVTELGTLTEVASNRFLTLYKRNFASPNMYLNNSQIEYESHPYSPNYGDIPLGALRFEKFDGNANVETHTVNWMGDPVSRTVTTNNQAYDERGRGVRYYLEDDIRNRLVHCMYSNADGGHWAGLLAEFLSSCSRIRYYEKVEEVDWRFRGEFLNIDATQLRNLGYDPAETEVKMDGEFISRIPTNFMSTSNSTLIQRLRDFTRKGIDEQLGFTSKNKIDSIPLIVVDLGSTKPIGYIDLQGGYLYKPPAMGDESAYDVDFKVQLKYTDKDLPFDQIQDSDFVSISDKLDDLDLNTGAVLSITDEDLGDRFKARYLKIYISSGERASITEGTEKLQTNWYGAAIAGLAIYESDLIVSEKYVNSNVINMYKDTTVYEELHTQELVDTYAQLKLNDFQKDNTLATVKFPWSPHYEIGQTVYLNDVESGNTARNYFIESISKGDGHTLSLVYYP